MDSWVAIDFETASARGTPCAVGLVEIDNGRIGQRHGWLIQPPVFEFSPVNVALHGITPEMCRGAPSWEEALSRISDIIDGRVLVAHNAAFDVGVIRDACEASELQWPRLRFACTLVVGRRIWPSLPTHSLPFLAAHLGIQPAAHHDPAADALCAAEIGCRALSTTGAATVEELVEGCNVVLGRLEPGEWSGCHGDETTASLPAEPSTNAVIDPAHPLFEKQIAFTGALAIPRREAQQAAVDCGAVASRGVTRHTDFLVAGYQDIAKLAQGASKSAKLRKAEALRAKGRPIQIIGEREFVQLLGEKSDV